jgi:hypothetical protein
MTHFREPTLFELLNDPVIQLVMRADGVTRDAILDLYAAETDGIETQDAPPAYICSGLLRTVSRPEA